MSSQEVSTEAPVWLITRHGFPRIHPSTIRLSLFFCTRMLSVNRGVEFADASGPFFSPAFTRFRNSCLFHANHASGLCAGDRRTRTASSVCLSLRRSDIWLDLASAPVKFCCLAGDSAAALDASIFMAWFKASFIVLSAPFKSFCFDSRSRIPSM